MPIELKLISSMATRALLAELAAACRDVLPQLALTIESVGGVDAARRVQAGEAFDGVVLAAEAIDKLRADGHVVGARIDLVRSGVAVAVRAGAPTPDLSDEDKVRQAVRDARSLGFSTGPSGTALLQLFQRWGLADELGPKLVQAPPGVPVGRMVAEGQVELGFQQLSELMSLAGITVVGPLPPAIQITTVFSAGVAATSKQAEAARALLAWWASAATSDLKRRHGMEPA
jgi:molybdate transport system substrate-binding protein